MLKNYIAQKPARRTLELGLQAGLGLAFALGLAFLFTVGLLAWPLGWRARAPC